MVVYGIDDGHSSIKIVNGKKENFPSRVTVGRSNSFNVITGEVDNATYTVNGNSYTVVGSDESAFDTRTEDFPTSDINVVLVNHALDRQNATGDIAICTGLPFNRFYTKGVSNSQLIEAKKTALSQAVKGCQNEFNIIKHFVCAEGVAGYYDLVLNDDGSFNENIKDAIADDTVVIVDIGGRTTDIVTFRAGKIDFSKSVTMDIGCLNVEDSLRENLQSELKCYDIPQTAIKKTIENQGIYISTKNEFDFSKILNESKRELASNIVNRLKAIVKNTIDLSLVVFIGGGSILVKDDLKALFDEKYIKFSKDPIYANARGMRKLATRGISHG
jgi:plasmid segregation protein ParM